MNDEFNKALWELGEDNPELQKAIAHTIVNAEGYSIPTRRVSTITEELEDITVTVMEIEDEAQRERAIARIKQARELTVADLATRLNILSIAYRIKEAKGETLTAQERTLRDLDITALAYTLRYMTTPKEAYQTFETPEDFDRAREEAVNK